MHIIPVDGSLSKYMKSLIFVGCSHVLVTLIKCCIQARKWDIYIKKIIYLADYHFVKSEYIPSFV